MKTAEEAYDDGSVGGRIGSHARSKMEAQDKEHQKSLSSEQCELHKKEQRQHQHQPPPQHQHQPSPQQHQQQERELEPPQKSPTATTTSASVTAVLGDEGIGESLLEGLLQGATAATKQAEDATKDVFAGACESVLHRQVCTLFYLGQYVYYLLITISLFDRKRRKTAGEI